MSFPMFRRSGPYLTDPRQLPRFAAKGTLFTHVNGNGAVTKFSDSENGIINLIAPSVGGVRVNSDWSANTYKTIANITDGAGLIAGFMGPEDQSGSTATITTWRIVVDGVSCEIPTRCHHAWDGTNGGREYIGHVLPPLLADGDAADHNRPWGLVTGGASLDSLTTWLGTPGAVIPSATDSRIPVLVEFKRSLFVEAKCSASNTSGGSNIKDCGINMFRTR